MSFTTLVRKYPVRTAVTCFALGAATTLLGVRFLGTRWNSERDPAGAMEEVRLQIEALRDPEDPSVRLSAGPTAVRSADTTLTSTQS
jgi:hypothetical protein